MNHEHHALHATFLDLDITVVDDVSEYNIYDKRHNYLFFFISMPDLSGNIPAYLFYCSILFEFLKIAKCIFKFFNFAPKAKLKNDFILKNDESRSPSSNFIKTDKKA